METEVLTDKIKKVPTSGQSGPPIDLRKEKLNPKEYRLACVLADDVNPVPLNLLAPTCFPDQIEARRNSWTRNALRRLVRGGWVEKVARGTYRLSEKGRSLLTDLPSAE